MPQTDAPKEVSLEVSVNTCFTIEINIQVNLKEVYPKFYSMKFDRIVSKLLMINLNGMWYDYNLYNK